MTATTPTASPTTDAYGEMQRAYDHFNRHLYDGSLPRCLITFQRKDLKTAGYYSANRFGRFDGTGLADEIALNPMLFKRLGLQEAMQTLVHEMAHLWQQHHGKPGRGRYHNAEWADKMEAIGLMPSSTGKPGGKRTGDHVADYAIQGSRFLEALRALESDGFSISYYDRAIDELQPEAMPAPQAANEDDDAGDDAPAKPQSSSGKRVKFVCPDCGCVAYGSSSLDLNCNPCDTPLVAQGT